MRLRSTALALALPALLIVLLSGCTGRADVASSPGPPASATPSPATSAAPSAVPSASAAPSAGSAPVADYTVEGFSATAVYELCRAAVADQYADSLAEYPDMTQFWPLAADTVTAESQDGSVIVGTPWGALADGRMEGGWVCSFSGDPASPTLDYVSPYDL